MLQRFTKQSCYWHSGSQEVSYQGFIYASRCAFRSCSSVEASQCNWDLLSQEQQKQLPEQLLWMLPRWATLSFWPQSDSKDRFASDGCNEGNIWANKWSVLLYWYSAHLCSSPRWLIANCLVSFPVIKFSLSPMLTTLGSSSPVVQTGELSSGTWMLRGRR